MNFDFSITNFASNNGEWTCETEDARINIAFELINDFDTFSPWNRYISSYVKYVMPKNFKATGKTREEAFSSVKAQIYEAKKNFFNCVETDISTLKESTYNTLVDSPALFLSTFGIKFYYEIINYIDNKVKITESIAQNLLYDILVRQAENALDFAKVLMLNEKASE